MDLDYIDELKKVRDLYVKERRTLVSDSLKSNGYKPNEQRMNAIHAALIVINEAIEEEAERAEGITDTEKTVRDLETP